MPSNAVYDAILGSVTLLQVQSSSWSANDSVAQDYTSGGLNPEAVYLVQAAPQVQFTTTDLEGVITDFTSSERLAVASGTITIPYNLRANGGTFASGSAHYQINATDGLFVVNSFAASQGDAAGATVSITGYLTKPDGVTMPATITASNSLASTAYNMTHQLGPVTVNGSALPGVVGVTINTGISVDVEHTDGGKYPRAAYITRRAPTMDIRFRDFDLMATLTPVFKTMTAAVVKFYKRAPGGTTVANGTAEHCSFTFADGVIETQTISASGNAAAEATLRLVGEALTISSTATIS